MFQEARYVSLWTGNARTARRCPETSRVRGKELARVKIRDAVDPISNENKSSHRTIARIIKKQGIKKWLAKKRPILKDEHAKSRYEWYKERAE